MMMNDPQIDEYIKHYCEKHKVNIKDAVQELKVNSTTYAYLTHALKIGKYVNPKIVENKILKVKENKNG